VREAGPFALREHAQNLPMMADPPVWGNAWETNIRGGLAGLAYCVAGRSLFWGGWSPQPLDLGADTTELPRSAWPDALVQDLSTRYYREASDQIGVSETNDFLYGPLHTALRQQLFDGRYTVTDAMQPGELPDHAAVRFSDPLNPPSDDDLRNWLGLPATAPALLRQTMLDLLKLEAPLAVQSQTDPGQFPVNK